MWLGRVVSNLGCVVGKDLRAGLAGTAAITGSEAIEMGLTGREPDTAAAEAVERVLGIKALDDQHKTQLAYGAHRGYGTSRGLFRALPDPIGVRDAAAATVHRLGIRAAAAAMLPGLEIAPPAREWSMKMHVTEGVGDTLSTWKGPG